MENIEIWKSLDFLGYPDYMVSNFGNVKSFKQNKEKLLKFLKGSNEYSNVRLCKNNKTKSFTVHKLVALAFISNPDNLPCVNHKDENRQNNYVDNLEWVTHQYNNTYNNVHIKRGEKMKGRKNSEETRRKISKALKGKYCGENSPNYRKQLTEEHKQKIRESNIGKSKLKCRKPILQYTLDNIFIREWDSAITASIELNINRNSIGQCCCNRIKSSGGYIWRYK